MLRRRTARMAVARGDAGFAVRGYAIMKRGYLFIALATLFFSTMEIALKEVAGRLKTVPVDGELVRAARELGLCMGD